MIPNRDQKLAAAKARRTLGEIQARISFGKVRGVPGLHVTAYTHLLPEIERRLGYVVWDVPVELRSLRPQASTPPRHAPQLSNPGLRRRVKNFLGGGLIKSIHPPPDPNPRVLDPEARAYWDSVRDDAYAYYGSSGAPKAKEVSERTAWRALRMHWAPRGRTWVRKGNPDPRPRRMLLPDPGDVVILGKLLEYVWINDDGSLDVCRWETSPPDLYWNQTQKTLYAFPNVPDQTVCEPVPQDMREEAKMFERWSQRKAQCMRSFQLDAEDSIIPMGVGDSLAYRSDKWHDRSGHPYLEDSQEYFHQFSDGNWIWQDSDTNPSAILIRGGQLDVEERGIIH